MDTYSSLEPQTNDSRGIPRVGSARRVGVSLTACAEPVSGRRLAKADVRRRSPSLEAEQLYARQPGGISVGKKGSPTCRRSPGCFRPKNPKLSADAASFDRGGHLRLPLRRKAPASWP